eukprot:jgi/Chrpa1/4766/Chrysochromulina_OHIO_Genome00013097-RA
MDSVEARAAAAAEGLKLVPSRPRHGQTAVTGFKGVYIHHGRYAAMVRENGKLCSLGHFATPEEAALTYARHIGAERAAVEAAEASSERPEPLTVDEALAAAASEGLELVPSKNETGFKGVYLHAKRYIAVFSVNDKKIHLGNFATAEEAALHYARHARAARAAAEAAGSRFALAAPQPLTADEARAAAAAEGLEFEPSSTTGTGFKGVTTKGSKFTARISRVVGGQLYLGIFATAEEAALHYARHFEAQHGATAAAEARAAVPQSKARMAAAAEGLELMTSSSSQTGFKGVFKNHSKYKAEIREHGKRRHLGNFSTPEDAALCYARYVLADRAAPEVALTRVTAPQPLTADEARAAAAAEGLELVPSRPRHGQTAVTGFKGVYIHHGRYAAMVREKGKLCSLGHFATPEEAALTYARHTLGAEEEAPMEKSKVAELMAKTSVAELTSDQVLAMADKSLAAAAAEGLELVPSSNETGFKCVAKNKAKYEAVTRENGKTHRLGTFATPEESALCYARYIGAERAAAEAAEARAEGPQLLTVDEARAAAAAALAAAAAEGLELVPSSRSNETGFKGVRRQRSGKYTAEVWENGKQNHLGSFTTPEKAALCIARYLGAERAAAEAATARAGKARAAAAAEGLAPPRSDAGFEGMHEIGEGMHEAKVMENGKRRYSAGTTYLLGEQLFVGARVEAQFGVADAEAWWPGTITQLWANGDVDVQYDDGDFEARKPRRRVRPWRAVASSQPAAWRTAPIALEDCGTCSHCLDKVKFGGPGIKRRVCKRKLEARLIGVNTDVDTAPSAPAAAEGKAATTNRAAMHDVKRRKMASGGTIHTVREDDESHEDDPSHAAGSSSSGSCPDGSSTQRVLARLQCTICLQTLEDPHSLPCIHTFCYNCIDQWARQSTELRCPLCKLPFFRRSILRNHTVAEIVRALACT